MTIRAVEGAAGCGKTHRLMDMLVEALREAPLLDGQRVLALTFYHGSRRRLLDRLRRVPGLSGRVECTTIDGFAFNLVRRWRGLVKALGLPPLAETQFDDVCNAAGMLLEEQQVRDWTARSFPVLLLDEGQDLSPQRLRMVRALADVTHTLIAADEFQCLDPGLRPNPLVGWLQDVVQTQVLTHVHRTNVPGLRSAATAIRHGQVAANAGQQFTVLLAPRVPLASTVLANAIAWHAGNGDVAIITPSRAGNYVDPVIARVCDGPCGKQQNGPYAIRWEGSDQAETARITAELNLDQAASAATTLAALHLLAPTGPVRQAIAWVQNQVHAVGRAEFSRAEIEATIGRYVTLRRQHGGTGNHRFVALTVQQAKNREFEGVVVLWPYQVGGDGEHKRRLLYNAVTRAKRWCTVIVQGQQIFNGPPFG